MNTKKMFVFGCVSMLLLSSIGIARADATPQQCHGQFEATVTQGRDAGFKLSGELAFQVEPSGELEGVLVTGDGSQVEVEGRIHNGRIRLSFELRESAIIRGSGAVDTPFTCTGSGGGSFTGPRRGDRGDWGVIWGS